MIAQHFPPAGGVGTFRVAKFAKYLREFGWEPVILTVCEGCYPKGVWLDRKLEKDIPQGVHLYRTRIWRSKIINDIGIRWLPFLLPAVVRVIRKERPQVVYITGGPFFPLIVAPIIKLLFRLPYVIDLRDPWKLARRANPTRGFKARLGQVLINFVEPIVLRHAAKVICATSMLRKEHQSAYQKQSEKFFTITNGYDPDDFNDILPKQYKGFTIIYTGKFRRSEAFHDPAPIFQAIKILRERGINVWFVHVGVREEEIITLAEDIGVGDAAEFVGPKSHSEALSYAVGASLLLVIGSDRKMGLPVKMFDYMGCQRPLLALGYEGEEMLDVTREIFATTLLVSEGPEAIAEAIENVYNKPRVEQAKSLTQRYTREYLTEVLAKVFNEVITGAK